MSKDRTMSEHAFGKNPTPTIKILSSTALRKIHTHEEHLVIWSLNFQGNPWSSECSRTYTVTNITRCDILKEISSRKLKNP